MRRRSSRRSITTLITFITIITTSWRTTRRTASESAVAAQRPGEAVESPQPNQMFKPYAEPGEGDDDGLSRDPDDCMKGCIGGNPQ